MHLFRTLALFLLVAVVAVGCDRSDDVVLDAEHVLEVPTRGPRPAIALRSLLALPVPASALRAPARRVFHSAQEFEGYFGAPATGVDFAHEWVAFVCAGEGAVGAADARIESVRPSLGGSMLLVNTARREGHGAYDLVAFAIPNPAPRTARFYGAATELPANATSLAPEAPKSPATMGAIVSRRGARASARSARRAG